MSDPASATLSAAPRERPTTTAASRPRTELAPPKWAGSTLQPHAARRRAAELADDADARTATVNRSSERLAAPFPCEGAARHRVDRRYRFASSERVGVSLQDARKDELRECRAASGSRSLRQAKRQRGVFARDTLGRRPERARRGGRREAPHSRGSTSLSATLLKLHRTAAFSAVLAANRNAASDLLHPAVGDVQVRSGRGSWTCFEAAALLTTAANLRTPKLPTSHRRDDVAGGTDTLAIAH